MGQADVDRLSESLPPGALLEWAAFERIEPDPLEVIIDVLRLGFAALSVGAHVSPDDLDPRRQKQEGGHASPNEMVAALRSQMR